MELRDSRRLTGPNILWHHPGAVIDVRLEEGEDAAAVVGQWRRQARRILDAVGWQSEQLAHRRFHSGVSLAMSAPIDALYAATEVNEWAWEATRRMLTGEDDPDLEEAASELSRQIAEERNPPVLALRAAAREHGVAFLWDDDHVSVGMGTGSRTFPVDRIPDPAELDWEPIHDIPVALVTGTNGKTTTVRLLLAMASAAGKTAGISSTDGCWVRGEEIGEGDYSGPGGARRVLRDPRVEIALLETARGGLLRRGLGVERADVAVVTNIAEDHLGEWGVHDLQELTATKMIVSLGAEHVVLSWDDPLLRAAAEELEQPLTFFALDEEALGEISPEHHAFGLAEEHLVRRHSGGLEELAPAREIPFTFQGAARHNVANALAACAVAEQLGIPDTAAREALLGFGSSPDENPGRLNHFDFGGASVIVDFAHNPHGLSALLELAARLPATRRAILVGQAGDRSDEDIRELPRLVWESRPDLVILKELPGHLRGRQLGEITELMARELRSLGASQEQIRQTSSEPEAVREALLWARPGDLLLLVTHEEREHVLSLLRDLSDRGWQPGDPIPG